MLTSVSCFWLVGRTPKMVGFVFTGNGGGGDDDVALLMLGMLVMVCLGCAAAPVLILRGDAAEGNGGAFS